MVGTAAPLANLSVVVSPAVLVRSSVLVSLSFIPYSAAIFSTDERKDFAVWFWLATGCHLRIRGRKLDG